jgi:hypothetical protein
MTPTPTDKPDESEIEEAEERADEAIRRARNAAEIERASRGGVEEDYAGQPPEHEPEEIDQPPRP